MVSDDEGTVPAPKRAARAAKRADSPVSTVSTAISTAAATVSAVASTATTATSEGRLRVCSIDMSTLKGGSEVLQAKRQNLTQKKSA